MTTPSAYVALLRGVNVSGANRLPMAAFRALLSDLGLIAPQTYIQSGNAVFRSDLPPPELEMMITRAIADRMGFAPACFVLSGDALRRALTDHPFQSAAPEQTHVFFLKETPVLDEAALRVFATGGEAWHLTADRLTLHTPEGFGRSKLAERLPRLLPTPHTARNLRSVAALVAIIGGAITTE